MFSHWNQLGQVCEQSALPVTGYVPEATLLGSTTECASSRSQGSTLAKMGLPRPTAFRFGQRHFEAVFNFYLIAGETASA